MRPDRRASHRMLRCEGSLRDGGHHTTTAGPREAQAHLLPDGQRVTDPGLFGKALLTPYRVHHDVEAPALDLDWPVRLGVRPPGECGGGQEVGGRAVGDGVPGVAAFLIRPVLARLCRAGIRDGRRHAGPPAALGDRQGDLAVERLAATRCAPVTMVSSGRAIRAGGTSPRLPNDPSPGGIPRFWWTRRGARMPPILRDARRPGVG